MYVQTSRMPDRNNPRVRGVPKGVFVCCRVAAMPHIMPGRGGGGGWWLACCTCSVLCSFLCRSSYTSAVPRSVAPSHEGSVFSMRESSARRFPDRPAIAWFGKHMTYAELLAEVERCSAMLAGLGVGKGDRVALIMPNSPPFTIAFYACMRLGAVAVGNNPIYTTREMRHQLDDADTKVVLVADLMYSAYAPAFPALGFESVVR